MTCARCEGAASVVWCGRLGQGGRMGPCPRCRVNATRTFVRMLRLDTFPDPIDIAVQNAFYTHGRQQHERPR